VDGSLDQTVSRGSFRLSYDSVFLPQTQEISVNKRARSDSDNYRAALAAQDQPH